MSEFSEKLSQYINQSGYSIYQLAREADIDRTTLQKTVKGQRLPSIEYVKDIVQYLKLSRRQEEELYALFKRAKYGSDVIDSWEEIHQIISDIPRLREQAREHGMCKLRFDRQSLDQFAENPQLILNSEMEIMRAVMCIVEQEIIEEDKPEIYMDVSYASQYALSQLMEGGENDTKPVICHQMVNLTRTDQSSAGTVGNFKILHQVLPYAFAFFKDYDIRYTYVTGNAEDQRYALWPHYIVTHRHVFLCSHDQYRAVVFSDKNMAECYNRELEHMLYSYRPLFTYQGFSNEGIHKYRKICEFGNTHVVYEDFPCLALLVPQEMQEELKKNPEFGDAAAAFFEASDLPSSQVIHIFGLKELKKFIQTGHVPGVYDHYLHEVSMECRQAMILNFYQHLKNHTRQFYLINDEELPACEGMSLELYGKNSVVLCSTEDESPFGFIIIDEPGICEAFYGYIENLLDSKFLYSVEETIERYEEIVREAFGETGIQFPEEKGQLMTDIDSEDDEYDRV